MRLFPTCAALLLISLNVIADPASREVWQPVQEYFIRINPNLAPVPITGTQRLNSFLAYTHMGTDFGFHGPAEHTVQWMSDEVCAHLGQEPDSWAGMWHSLAGLARESDRSLNFAAAWPASIGPEYQPRITGVMLDASGLGRLKLEIKDARQGTLWSRTMTLSPKGTAPMVLPVAPESVPDGKLINWTAEPGTEVCVSALRLMVETPAVPFDAYVLAASYAKLARCYDARAGFVKDRAHIEDGAFESIPATGMFALATAVVSQAPLKIVSPVYASASVHQIQGAVRALKRPHGLLPHFVRLSDGVYRIHPGTEYSTVDTALYYQALVLAARIMKDAALEREVLEEVRAIDVEGLRMPSGYLSHGLKDDGETRLRYEWSDWGGETAMVMLLQSMARENTPRLPTKRPGQAWQGTAFIPEVQSLFYPDFDSDEPDAVDGVRWLSVRRNMLSAQRQALNTTWPESLASKLGLYGYSAGEGENGSHYHVGGTDLPNQRLVHPHYVLMSATVAEHPADVYALLQRLERAGLFPPWGLVENVTVTGSNYLPMNGALNAAFETLGAYHLLAKSRNIGDGIYQAGREVPEIRQAMTLFYPERIASMPPPVQAASAGGSE